MLILRRCGWWRMLIRFNFCLFESRSFIGKNGAALCEFCSTIGFRLRLNNLMRPHLFLEMGNFLVGAQGQPHLFSFGLPRLLITFSFFRKKKQKIAPYGNLPGFCSKKSSENQAVLARKIAARTLWFSFARNAGADFLLQKPDGKFPEVALVKPREIFFAQGLLHSNSLVFFRTLRQTQ